MNVEKIIAEAGKQLKTLKFNYIEADGTNEGTREVEPYSYRDKSEGRLFFGFDIAKGGIRSFKLEMIRDIRITENIYVPRWDVEV